MLMQVSVVVSNRHDRPGSRGPWTLTLLGSTFTVAFSSDNCRQAHKRTSQPQTCVAVPAHNCIPFIALNFSYFVNRTSSAELTVPIQTDPSSSPSDSA